MEKEAGGCDELTGLTLGKQLPKDLAVCLSHGTGGYMLIFDVNNLADINLQKGREAGDYVLKDVARTLNLLFKDWDKAYRLDSDRFAALLFGYEHQEIEEMCRQLNKLLERKCTVSVGATYFDGEKDREAINVIQRAEVALKSSKQNMHKDVVFFSETGYKEYLCRVKLQNELRDSIHDNFAGFFLCYQPLISGKDYSLLGAEALLRYTSPRKGLMSPAQFIPVLEETEMICPVGLWVLYEALKQCKKWRELCPAFRVNVNVSYIQLDQNGFAEDVLKALDEVGVPGDALTLEITESIHLHDFERCNAIFSMWEQAGIHISVDDFGTGYSSLSYLKKLHFNNLKVDQYFIAGITETPYNYKLISNVLDLANFSNITVCLEGVETEEQLQIIQDLRADCLQGYIFSKPVVAQEFEKKFMDTEAAEYQEYRAMADRLNASKPKKNTLRSHLFWTMMKGEPGYDVVDNNRENILRRMRLGLWITRFTPDKTKCEMYLDAVCAEIMGLEKPLPAEEAYWYWKHRICEECRDYVNYETQRIINDNLVVQLEYWWQHPVLGRVRVRCVSVRASDSDGMITIKGYHRIVSDIETTTYEEWLHEQKQN